MIPSEYKLEQVAARLTSRLESTRRSYAGDPEGAAHTFARIADEVVEDAIAEYREDGFVDAPERHARLLRAEISETFLPRYTRMATAMTEREEGGFGLGALYGIMGRSATFIGLAVLWLIMLRLPGPWSLKLAPLFALLLGVFVPDVIAWIARRRYRLDLVDLMGDMQRIQEHASDYARITEGETARKRPDTRPTAQ